MPRATIWITEENYPAWQALENKSGWINEILTDVPADLFETDV